MKGQRNGGTRSAGVADCRSTNLNPSPLPFALPTHPQPLWELAKPTTSKRKKKGNSSDGGGESVESQSPIVGGKTLLDDSVRFVHTQIHTPPPPAGEVGARRKNPPPLPPPPKKNKKTKTKKNLRPAQRTAKTPTLPDKGHRMSEGAAPARSIIPFGGGGAPPPPPPYGVDDAEVERARGIVKSARLSLQRILNSKAPSSSATKRTQAILPSSEIPSGPRKGWRRRNPPPPPPPPPQLQAVQQFEAPSDLSTGLLNWFPTNPPVGAASNALPLIAQGPSQQPQVSQQGLVAVQPSLNALQEAMRSYLLADAEGKKEFARNDPDFYARTVREIETNADRLCSSQDSWTGDDPIFMGLALPALTGEQGTEAGCAKLKEARLAPETAALGYAFVETFPALRWEWLEYVHRRLAAFEADGSCNYTNLLVKGELIGKGSFGHVYRAKLVDDPSGFEVALKIVDTNPEGVLRTEGLVQAEWLPSLATNSLVRDRISPNFSLVFSHCIEHNVDCGGGTNAYTCAKGFIVSELAVGSLEGFWGDLRMRTILFGLKQENEIRLAMSMLIQLLLALVAMARVSLTHNDAYLRNILVTRIEEVWLEFKLPDGQSIALPSMGALPQFSDWGLARARWFDTPPAAWPIVSFDPNSDFIVAQMDMPTYGRDLFSLLQGFAKLFRSDGSELVGEAKAVRDAVMHAYELAIQYNSEQMYRQQLSQPEGLYQAVSLILNAKNGASGFSLLELAQNMARERPNGARVVRFDLGGDISSKPS
jgi:hypothetical protein